ncbi:MAG: hypothetical protein LBS23_02050 [Holosporaceae bacterium]|jgi:hypothetical protein|nr:hypothetical protein [Holosporaceae bacterium]
MKNLKKLLHIFVKDMFKYHILDEFSKVRLVTYFKEKDYEEGNPRYNYILDLDKLKAHLDDDNLFELLPTFIEVVKHPLDVELDFQIYISDEPSDAIIQLILAFAPESEYLRTGSVYVETLKSGNQAFLY